MSRPTTIKAPFAPALALVPLLALGALGQVQAQSQSGTTAVSFLEIPAGARSIGLGEAYVSLANDLSALYWNPAGITQMESNQASFETTDWFIDTRLHFSGAVIRSGDSYFGASVYMFDGGLMDVRTLTYPEGTGEEFSVMDISLGFSYARSLTENFSLGGTVKMVQSRIWRMRATSPALDLGFRYQTPLDRVQLGFAISNFGSEMRLSGDNTFTRVDLDPQNAGNNDGIPASLLTKSWDLPLIFRIGFNWIAVQTMDLNVLVAADAVYPNNNENYVNIGAEATYRRIISLRGGYSHLFLNDAFGLGHLRWGVGLTAVENVSIQYAFSERGDLGGVNTIGATIHF